MEVIKIGSKGEAVKVLQKALGIEADGVFGNGTDKAVKAYQASHGLTADGIVGSKTWASLGITDKQADSSKVVGEGVIYKPLPIHISNRNGKEIKYLVIHYTGSSNSKAGRAQNTYNTFMQRQASADFCVDDRDIVQFNPDPKKYYCWSVGGKKYGGENKGGKFYGKCYNTNSISIEICSTCVPATSTAVNTNNHIGWSFTDAVLDNAVKVARMVMRKYNIPIERVIRHYDVTGKLCPAIIGWNDEPTYTLEGKRNGGVSTSKQWEKFLERLK